MFFNKGIGFDFDNFKPQPIFQLIQETAKRIKGVITDEEMFKTFNMGWGFAVVVENHKTDEAIDALERSGVEAEQIGTVTSLEKIVVNYKGKKIILKS
jgi:phosphoribosylformylglycinamidine cyclo-ligase